jgi:hypothetical protein
MLRLLKGSGSSKVTKHVMLYHVYNESSHLSITVDQIEDTFYRY